MRSMSLCARRCYNLPLLCVRRGRARREQHERQGQGASNGNDKAKARAANGGGGDAGGVVECSACGETHEDQARAAGAVGKAMCKCGAGRHKARGKHNGNKVWCRSKAGCGRRRRQPAKAE